MTAREYLFSLELFGIKLGLDQIRGLLAALDHPDRTFRSLIIAGTNGKGSTAAMIERALRAAGYRTGRYTSPHLVDIEERFCLDGRPIPAATFDRSAARVRDAAAPLAAPPSFFEATTAVALDTFREAAVDVAVLEVGLGGRLDATNAVTPIAGAITSIDLDHQQYLGHTLAAIAAEKAGVIKPDMLVAVADNRAEVDRVIADAARVQHAELVRAADVLVERPTLGADGRMAATLTSTSRRHEDVTLALRGRHQLANATTAVALLDALDARGHLSVPAAAVRCGLEDAVWPARLELVETGTGPILIDGAHNPAGAAALASYVHEVYGRKLPFVMGVMRDKDIAGILTPIAAVASHVVFTSAASGRATTPEELVAIAATVAPALPAEAAATPDTAIVRARAFGSPIVVAGSLYLAGEVRSRVVS